MMNGREIIASLKRKLRVTTDKALAVHIGVTVQSIHNWKNRRSVSSRQLVGLVHSASVAAADSFQANAIRPLVEFFPITKCESRQGGLCELFATTLEDDTEHPCLVGLREELEVAHGVYLFFDSRGRAIYVGKARKRGLWGEMKGAFNRDRRAVQRIKRVKHPTNKVRYRPSEVKSRQIREYWVPLHDLAAYFSAYEVADTMIANLEALLVRSFANDLLNIRMERFARFSTKN